MRLLISALLVTTILAAGCSKAEGAESAPPDQPPKSVELATPATKSDPGKTYRHPIGFSFWQPANWSVRDQQDYLQLVPPNPGSNAQGPTEAYMIFGESVADEGISSPTDPQVISYLDQQVRSLLPFVTRKGGAKSVNMTTGKGAVINWEGTNPNNNLHILARCYVGIIGTSAVSLTGLGDKKLVEKRDGELRTIFASFGIGKGKIDPQLVRTWTFLRNVAISNQSPFETAWTRAQFASDTASTLELRANGTWTRRDVSRALLGGGGVWLDTGRQEEVFEGRWSAGNGTLYLMYKDDSWSIYQYRLEGNKLRLARSGKGELWEAK
jgi:hypothetical protein